MLSHEGVWAAIDALAEAKGLTPSGLARAAGLDPTSFNKSKRVTGVGRPRWPSTESIARVLRATDTDLDTFMALIPDRKGSAAAARSSTLRQMPDQYGTPGDLQVPLLGFAQAGVGGFFDDGGFPAGQGWDEIKFPNQDRDAVYALQVSGDSMLPLYRDGDIIIVAPGATIRKGDRVVVKTQDGEVMAKLLVRRSSRMIELQSLNPEHPDRTFSPQDIDWMARIIWASQ